MLNYICSVFRCFTTQRGDYSSRTSCKTLWGFSLVLAGMILLILESACLAALHCSVFWGRIAVFSALVLFIELIPTALAAIVRRFHDRNLSGYWTIPCLLVPVIGWTAGAIVTFFLPGQVQENKYPRQSGDVRPFWKLKRFWLLHAAVVLTAITQLSYSPVTITENSHYIVQPKTEDGKVDYAKAAFKKIEPLFSNPNENGVRMIFQLYGSIVYPTTPDDADWKDACKQLQLDPNLKPKYDSFSRFEDYLAENKIDVNTLVYDKEAFSRRRPKYVYGTNAKHVNELKQEDDEDDARFQERFAHNVYSFYADAMFSGAAWTSFQHPAASKWLDDRAAEMESIAQAVRMPVYQYPLPYQPPTVFRELYPAFFVSYSDTLFNMRIRRSLGDKNVDLVLDDVETLLLFARHLKNGSHTLVISSFNMRHAYILHVCNALKTALRTPGFCESLSDAQWARLNNLLSQDYFVDLSDVLDGEWIFCYYYLQKFFDKSAQCHLEDSRCVESEIIALLSLLVDENSFRQQAYKDRLTIQDAFLEKDRAVRKQKMEELSNDAIISLKSFTNWITIRQRSRTAAHLYFHLNKISYVSFLNSRDLASAQLKLVQAAIAIERYRIKEGKYPESLDQLTPKYWDEKKQGSIRFDPFSGKETLGYRLNEQSSEEWERELKQGREKDPEYRHQFDDVERPVWRPFILYSVGSDLKDDNGDILLLDLREQGDVIF